MRCIGAFIGAFQCSGEVFVERSTTGLRRAEDADDEQLEEARVGALRDDVADVDVHGGGRGPLPARAGELGDEPRRSRAGAKGHRHVVDVGSPTTTAAAAATAAAVSAAAAALELRDLLVDPVRLAAAVDVGADGHGLAEVAVEGVAHRAAQLRRAQRRQLDRVRRERVQRHLPRRARHEQQRGGVARAVLCERNKRKNEQQASAQRNHTQSRNHAENEKRQHSAITQSRNHGDEKLKKKDGAGNPCMNVPEVSARSLSTTRHCSV